MSFEIPKEIASAFKARERNATKRSVGVLTIVGGSEHYIHAPVITALGARAAGAGLVQLVVPAASRIAAGSLVPEATFTKLGVTSVPPKADVTIVGMGLGVSVSTEAILSRLLSVRKGRFIVDADALTILAGWYASSEGYMPAEGQEIVLTPHEGEAARLLGVQREEIAADRLGAAKEIASRYHSTVVLKGPASLVVSKDAKRVYENVTGNPFMALGGMGDLLAGIIGARWAYLKDDAFLSTASAVWLHGLASDEVVSKAIDPSIVNSASMVGSLRVRFDA